MVLIYLKQIFDAKLDFTYPKYVKLCKVVIDANITILTVKDYVLMNEKPDKFVIFRHDIDDEVDLYYASKMAKTEAELGFKTTYYFRTCEKVFKPEIIREIVDLGHEMGYHYEVLGDAEGDYSKAIELFGSELGRFREVCDVKTIAQHGGPLRSGLNVVTLSNMLELLKCIIQRKPIFDHWESKEIWKKYDFRDYEIIGEPYLSIDFDSVVYLSDTNRSWIDTKYRLKDRVGAEQSINAVRDIRRTDDLIEAIESGRLQRIHILIHPSNWKETFGEWVKWFMLQQMRNAGKRLLVMWRQRARKREDSIIFA
jgi:hypothetical protein